MCWDEAHPGKGSPWAPTQRVRQALGSELYTLIKIYLNLQATYAYS